MSAASTSGGPFDREGHDTPVMSPSPQGTMEGGSGPRAIGVEPNQQATLKFARFATFLKTNLLCPQRGKCAAQLRQSYTRAQPCVCGCSAAQR